MSSQLTPRENQLLVLGFKCTETQPKIDYAKLATLAGLKNAGVASVMYGNAKRKLMKLHDKDLTSNTEPGATLPPATPDATMSSTTGTTPTTKAASATKAKAPAKATPTPRKRKASAMDNASPGASNLTDVEASTAKGKGTRFVPKKIKVLDVDLPGENESEEAHELMLANMKKEQAEADAQLKGNLRAASHGGARVKTPGAKNEEATTASASPDAASNAATALDGTAPVAAAGPRKRGRAPKKESGTKTETTTKTTAKARTSKPKSKSKTPAPAPAPMNAASAEVEAALAAYRASVDRNLEGGELMSSEELDREIENAFQDTPDEQSGVRPGL